jgi:hypothetical protein
MQEQRRKKVPISASLLKRNLSFLCTLSSVLPSVYNAAGNFSLSTKLENILYL